MYIQLLLESQMSAFRPTWNTNMAAASIEQLAGTRAALLPAGREDMDVIGSVLEIGGHYSQTRTVILVGTVNNSCVPVSPVDILLEHCHSKWVLCLTKNDLPVLSSQRGTLNLIPVTKRVKHHFYCRQQTFNRQN